MRRLKDRHLEVRVSWRILYILIVRHSSPWTFIIHSCRIRQWSPHYKVKTFIASNIHHPIIIVGSISPIQMYILQNVYSPTLHSKGAQTPPNISNTDIYIKQNKYSQNVGSISAVKMYMLCLNFVGKWWMSWVLVKVMKFYLRESVPWRHVLFLQEIEELQIARCSLLTAG